MGIHYTSYDSSPYKQSMNDIPQEEYKQTIKALEYKYPNKNKDNSSWGKILFGLVGILFLAPFFCAMLAYTYFANGFVLTKLWEWFLFPITDVHINIYQAIGIAIVVSFLTHQAQSFPSWYQEHFEKDYPLGKKFIYTFGLLSGPWLILFFGYVIHKLM